MRHWMLLLATWMPCMAQAANSEPVLPPTHIHAQYALIKNGIEVAEIDDLYARDTDRYTLSSTARPVGLIALIKPGRIIVHSNGAVTPQGLQPLQFNYRYEADQHKDSNASFLWGTHQLLLHHDGLDAKLDLPRGTQDRLSAMYQFIFLHLRDRQRLEFPMTNGSKLDQYHYTITTGEPCNSSAGKFDALYLDSEAKKGETRTQIWLATARNNLPCKIIVTDPEGGKLTQELRALDTQP